MKTIIGNKQVTSAKKPTYMVALKKMADKLNRKYKGKVVVAYKMYKPSVESKELWVYVYDKDLIKPVTQEILSNGFDYLSNKNWGKDKHRGNKYSYLQIFVYKL